MTSPKDPFGPPSDPSGSSSPWETPPGGAAPAPGSQQPSGSPDPGQTYGQPTGSQQQGFGQPPGSQWGGPSGERGPKRNGLGIAALVLGILALLTSLTVVGGILLGLAAIVLGVLGRGRAKKGEADNGGTAIAGIVLGVLGVVISGIVVAAGVALFQSDGGQQLIDCLEQAGNDVAAQDACERELAEDLEQ